MTTYPQPSDPVATLSRADGTTEAHSTDHGRIIGVWENVKHHGAVSDGVTDDTAAIQAAIDAAAATGSGFADVYFPNVGSYLITGSLTLPTQGARFRGGGLRAAGHRIKCNNFPVNTDVIVAPDTATFTVFIMENMTFDHDTGQAPRDFIRLPASANDNIGLIWEHVAITNMSGMGINCMDGRLAVGWQFTDVHITGCQGGGTYIGDGNALSFINCRWAGNVGNGGTFDLSIGDGSGSSHAISVISPTFDGFDPGSSDFDRCRITGTGIYVAMPYIEYGPYTLTGARRDFYLAGVNIVLDGGQGGSAGTIGGGGTHTAVEIAATSNDVSIMSAPLELWRGDGLLGLKVGADCYGIVINAGLTTGKWDIASDASVWWLNGHYLIENIGKTTATVAGATPDTGGRAHIYITQSGATNVTNVTGGWDGQVLSIEAGDGLSTLKHGAGGTGEFALGGGIDYTIPNGRTIQFKRRSNVWHEMGRFSTLPTAYTQTYSTADKTQANLTVGADLGAFTDPPSAAEMAALRTFVNALKADLTDVKQITNSLIDDLQALGLVG